MAEGGIDNGVLYGINFDLRGVTPIVGQFTADGQMLFGATAAPFARVGLLTGTNNLTYIPSAGGGAIGVLGAPTNPGDVATKSYVDSTAGGAIFKQFVVAASTLPYTVLYFNGVAGVGATLTNADTQAAFSIDGQSPSVSDRVLIKNQASTLENGCYTVTDVGSGATNWVLTRSTDYDSPSEIKPGTVFPVELGTVNANTSWIEANTVTNVGIDPIQFTQFTYNAATFLQVLNNLSDLNNVVTARSNLGLGSSATHAATDFLQAANNLSDVANAATARTNLGLGTAATHASTDFLQAANNLSDVANAATARSNLGLGSASTHAATDFLLVANNLSDLNNTTTARSNLGLGSIAVLSDPLTETHGGTAQTSYTLGDILYASAANTLSKLPSNATATRYLANTGVGNIPNWDQINLTNGVTGILPVANGGSGSSSGLYLQIANNLSDLNNTTTARSNLGLGSAATHASTDFLQAANNLSDLSNTITARSNLGLGSAATHAATDFLLAANNLSDIVTPATARTNLGLGTAATHAATDFLQVANNLSDLNNTTTARSNLGLGSIAVLSDPLTETHGGTGQTSYSQGDMLYASGANTLSKLAKSAVSTAYLSNTGAANSPAWSQIALGTGVSGTLPETNGGTNQNTYTQGDTLFASAANTLSKLAKNTVATRYLANTGVNNDPAWDQINLANGVTGQLTVPNGGTGDASFTAFSVICAGTTSTAAFQNVAGLGSSGQVLTSNGAGALPTWQTAGAVVPVTNPGAYPYTTLTTDIVIIVDTSVARTIVPLGSPTKGQTYRIKDGSGLAATNNITITPSGKNIDGAASTVININYGSVDITYNGTEWSIL